MNFPNRSPKSEAAQYVRIFAILVSFLMPSLSAIAGSDQQGTLTVTGDSIIFAWSGGTDTFPLAKVPGIKVVSYVLKREIKDGKEIDISTLTILTGETAKPVVMTVNVPVSVSRTIQNSGVHWTVEKNNP